MNTPRKIKAANRESGFSLIEIIIVLLIISIMVVAAAPQIQRSLQFYRVESAASLLSNRLIEAKLTAVKYNRASWVQINTSNRTLEVWTTNQLNQEIRTKLAVTLSDDVTIDPASPSRVTFTSLGRNQAGSSSLVKLRLANTNYCKSIGVSIVGNITTAPC